MNRTEDLLRLSPSASSSAGMLGPGTDGMCDVHLTSPYSRPWCSESGGNTGETSSALLTSGEGPQVNSVRAGTPPSPGLLGTLHR
jgi:hypothetical protein